MVHFENGNFWALGTIAFDPTVGSFTLGELVSLVKVFRLFKLEQMFFGVESGHSR